MYPNQNQYSIDYLNQIAPKPQKPRMSTKKMLLLIGGILAVVIIIAAFTFSSKGAGPTEKMETLAARLKTLQDISDKAQKNIKSNEIRGINSNLTIFITNTNHDLIEPLKLNGVTVTSINKDIQLAENGKDLTAKLEDARLNAVYDRTYAREMAYQLETVISLMKDIYSRITSKSLKDILANTDVKLEPIIKQLNDFSAANS